MKINSYILHGMKCLLFTEARRAIFSAQNRHYCKEKKIRYIYAIFLQIVFILLLCILFSIHAIAAGIDSVTRDTDVPPADGGTDSEQFIKGDFYKSILMVSNIQFCESIVPIETRSQYRRNDLAIISIPSNRFSKSNPVFIYFELYNLRLDDEENTSYRIQYVVQRSISDRNIKIEYTRKDKESLPQGQMREPRGYLAIENQIAAKGSEQANYILMDMSRLDTGTYDFLIIVSDLMDSQHTVGQRQIELIP